MRRLAMFYAGWDRLDHAAAARVDLMAAGELPPAWQRLYPPQTVRDWVRWLSTAPPRRAAGKVAQHQRLLAIDLLANAERRVRQLQFEDGLVRSYRIAELCAQARLAARGFDLDHLAVDDPRLRMVLPRLQRNGIVPRNPPPGWRLRGREQLVALLDVLGDPGARRLADFDAAHSMLDTRHRNDSILIHGDRPRGGAGDDEWHRLLSSLERLVLLEAGDRAAQHLTFARFPTIWSL
jgi:hypothetical protein